MSDRGEGLLRSIPAVFPDYHHGYCYYHLKQNLPIRKSNEKYKEVMDCLKKATYALSPAKYKEALMQKEFTGRDGIANYCHNIPKECCSSAFFTGCRFGQTTSSVADSFKRRELSVLMDPEFLTPTYQGSHTVDLLSKTCTCQGCRVYGFPCSHAIAVIFAKGDRYVDYIQYYFKVTHFQQLYSIAIRPVPNYNRPEQYEPEDTIFPPHPRVPPGRPKGNRIKNAWEKSRKSVRCSNCHKKTHHNKATCTVIPSYP
ncbi:uncharacterized protein LOC113306100 [Papaver somniferum]|uniref:uncharacterized protein LOC113306100 n=1 Tax=Papaver somniferum TaxID=3469 RepID=UPI000E6FA92D|nr:uncharacterized protein LOC113306100 [Papaver somniferum]